MSAAFDTVGRWADALTAFLLRRCASLVTVRRDTANADWVHVFTEDGKRFQHVLINTQSGRTFAGHAAKLHEFDTQGPFVKAALSLASERHRLTFSLGGTVKPNRVQVDVREVEAFSTPERSGSKRWLIESRRGDERLDSLRYLVDGEVKWSHQGESAWEDGGAFDHGEHAFLIYCGLDLMLVTLEAATGRVVAHRALNGWWGRALANG